MKILVFMRDKVSIPLTDTFFKMIALLVLFLANFTKCKKVLVSVKSQLSTAFKIARMASKQAGKGVSNVYQQLLKVPNPFAHLSLLGECRRKGVSKYFNPRYGELSTPAPFTESAHATTATTPQPTTLQAITEY